MMTAIAIIFGIVIGTSLGPQHCDRTLPQTQFESQGGRLQELSSLSHENLASEVGCTSGPCFGSIDIHALITQDGSVASTGVDHHYGKDVMEVITRRLERMRYVPPRLAGKPVCVSFDVLWDGDRPEELRKISP